MINKNNSCYNDLISLMVLHWASVTGKGSIDMQLLCSYSYRKTKNTTALGSIQVPGKLPTYPTLSQHFALSEK